MNEQENEDLELWSEDEPTDAFPRKFGKFTLVRRVAKGGMAEILLAKAEGQLGFEKSLVIKRILPHLTGDSSFIEMFLSEAKIAARLHHPNIAQIYDIGRIEGQYFIAMEYVDGVTLMDLIKRALWRSLQLPLANIVHLIKEVALGLHYAHDAKDAKGMPLNLVHRDVSPSNIMVSRDGVAKLVDFGVATASNQLHKTVAGALKGKFGYMSPEQIEGESLDSQSDIFSLGIVLYEATTCRRLFGSKTPAETIRRVTSGKIPEPSAIVPGYPPPLRDIVFKMLALKKADRYLTARDVHVDLNRFEDGVGARINSIEQGRVLRDFLEAEGEDAGRTLVQDHTTRTTGVGSVPTAWSTGIESIDDLDEDEFESPDIEQLLSNSLPVLGPRISSPRVPKPQDPMLLIAVLVFVFVILGSIISWALILS